MEVRNVTACAPGDAPLLTHAVIIAAAAVLTQLFRADWFRRAWLSETCCCGRRRNWCSGWCERTSFVGHDDQENEVLRSDVAVLFMADSLDNRRAIGAFEYGDRAGTNAVFRATRCTSWIWFPWRSLSECLSIPLGLWTMVVAFVMIISWSAACFRAPHYTMITLAFACAFFAVCWTQWTTPQHRVATTMFSYIVLAISFSLALKFIRPRDEALAYALVGVQGALILLFISRGFVSQYIHSRADDAQLFKAEGKSDVKTVDVDKRRANYAQVPRRKKWLHALCGRNWLVVLEYANLASFLAVLGLVRV